MFEVKCTRTREKKSRGSGANGRFVSKKKMKTSLFWNQSEQGALFCSAMT